MMYRSSSESILQCIPVFGSTYDRYMPRSRYCADTKAAFDSIKASAGLKNVHFLDITVNGTGAWDTPPGTIGCDRHPSQTAHALMGKIATMKVKAAMGW